MDPDPRGTGLLKAEPASSHSLPALCADGSQGAEGRTCDGGAGLCGKNSGLAPAGPVSTALTSTGTTSVRPAGIVGILRFLFGVRRRRACDVSTVDTTTRQASPLSPPRLLDQQPAPDFRPSECLRGHDTQLSQEDYSWD